MLSSALLIGTSLAALPNRPNAVPRAEASEQAVNRPETPTARQTGYPDQAERRTRVSARPAAEGQTLFHAQQPVGREPVRADTPAQREAFQDKQTEEYQRNETEVRHERTSQRRSAEREVTREDKKFHAIEAENVSRAYQHAQETAAVSIAVDPATLLPTGQPQVSLVV